MAAMEFHVTYCTADGIQHKLLFSSLDIKSAMDGIFDVNNNINVKNSVMPWQCQNTQDNERSLHDKISNTLMGMNSIVCKDNLNQNDKLDVLSIGAPIDSKVKSPIDKEFIHELKTDKKLVNANSYYSCSLCGYKCQYEAIFTNHLLSHRIEKSPIDEDFIDKLKTDKKSLNAKSKYNCSVCGYKCQYEAIFNNHLLSHGIENTAQMEVLKPESPLDKHTCSQCRYITTNKAMYNKHIINKHILKSGHNTLSCPECREKFGSTFDLHKHKLTHALGSVFACPLCEYKGQKLIELKKHLLKHSEKRLFNCSKCEFASRKIHILEKHMLSHTEKEDENVQIKIKVKSGRKIRTNIIQGYDRRDLKTLFSSMSV